MNNEYGFRIGHKIAETVEQRLKELYPGIEDDLKELEAYRRNSNNIKLTQRNNLPIIFNASEILIVKGFPAGAEVCVATNQKVESYYVKESADEIFQQLP